ncbi:MAG TPA: lyase family protein [Candidatus Obscuribacterales bacterium]
MVSKRLDVRIERDSLGEVQIPAGALWGIQTARLREMTFATGIRAHSKLIDAMAIVKKACAAANMESRQLDAAKGRAVMQACDELLGGQWHDHVIVEFLQSGAGTAFNINFNELLANRASEILGGQLGSYEEVHPYRHVNMGQSVNDVFPTAMRISILLSAREFEPALLDMERLLRRKALEFERVLKVGRTHLQDSVPITLGQEFNAYGSSVERSLRRIKEASSSLTEVNTGATFVGTGMNADSNFVASVLEKISSYSGIRVRQSEDYFRVSQSMADFVEFSSSLKELAIELTKIANDLRLLNSGPSAGIGEIKVPSLITEPSPLMPGTLPDSSHPTLAESLNMVCYQVMGNDTVVGLAAQAGQLESNVMTPLIIQNILMSLDLLRGVIPPFNQKFLAGITANNVRCRQLLENGGLWQAIISSQLGAEQAAALMKEAADTGVDVKKLVVERNLISQDVLDRFFSPKYLTSPGASFGTASGANRTDKAK